jgi:putative holliday junction resolvase
MARILGIDYGERRIGLALSDPTGTVATPWRVLDVEHDRADAKRIAQLCDEQKVDHIVIGLPLAMNGSEGPAAKKCQAFAVRLRETQDRPVTAWDERFTTRSAQQALIAGGARRSKRKEVVDKLAAQIMLQHYLDAQAGSMMS